MYRLYCRTCAKEEIFGSLGEAQEAFSGHVEGRHEAELFRLKIPEASAESGSRRGTVADGDPSADDR